MALELVQLLAQYLGQQLLASLTVPRSGPTLSARPMAPSMERQWLVSLMVELSVPLWELPLDFESVKTCWVQLMAWLSEVYLVLRVPSSGPSLGSLWAAVSV